ncbi:MAG: hypothetical protein ABI197_04090 [Granulicella sp.]
MGLAEGLHRRSGSAGLPASPERLAERRLRTAIVRHHGASDASRDRSLERRVVDLRAMAVEFPVVEGHPNRLPFEGVLTLVDVPSDKAPSGSRGHRVVLTHAAAQAALPSLLGMAVDYKAGWDGHDARQKCGIITSARIDGKQLTVAGYLFARDYPELQQKVEVEGVMGMSYELADAHVADMRAPVWTLTRATFTGAAILLRDKAAYRSTSFRLKRAVPLQASAKPAHRLMDVRRPATCRVPA